MEICLRNTKNKDLKFVLQTEQDKENCLFITQWTIDQHRDALSNNDMIHFVIEQIADSLPVGYGILTGLKDVNCNIELKRIVVAQKGKGYGRKALELVKDLAFNKLKAHRLWLDVKEHNSLARQLYRKLGFVEEGILRECINCFESLVIMSILRREYESI